MIGYNQMSPFGTERTSVDVRSESALSSKAEVAFRIRQDRFYPSATWGPTRFSEAAPPQNAKHDRG
jgi:hypothetical protein